MVIYEADVPGVGKRYEVETGDGERAVVIIHHDGKRELFRRADPDADAEKLFDLTAEQSRQLATSLEGTDFQPLDLDDIDVPLGGALMEWVEIPEKSPVAGETMGSVHLGKQTGVTIAAIQRGDETIGSPGADTTLQAGDILVAIGSRSEQNALESLLETGSVEDSD
ncbi:potassium transporter TrkA [Halobacterium sp. KA-4]|uniref:cation:proton antiporter regulatory subunit n=1 Tax=Halobacterium sp. KA-4 TaxID=2896367 RepID=UPI001E4D64CA|nr:TrkA C-terminal domain-containing protein [Halobacterium sp. KA-4]MCD2198996.1 potassium transporter TrkA [Halobacterium sp. KA-4]